MIENEIKLTADLIFNLSLQRIGELENQPTEFLRDLKHLCDEKKSHPDYSVRVSAEINLAVCDLILETRA